MMFKKALTKSGRRILRAIKRISSTRLAKKLQQQQEQQQQQQIYQQQQQQQQQEKQQWSLQQRLYELDSYSGVSCSLPSLDAKSVDTFVTYVQPDGLYQSEECYVPHCCCCSCNENEENQRNENLENEMMR